ncbi:MAG: DinB family protein [Acidobacteria bacterium]|nr:DinB family protein [Acidobacteriota bacterium]
MDAETRQREIARYKDGYRVVAEALAGATGAELDARPAPDAWSAREIVHHLADSEMTSAIRLRRLVAEEQPAIAAYDQDLFARRLYYDRPIASSLEAFRFARATTAEILDRLTEEEWAREGTHSEVGRFGVETWLEIYAKHAHGHASQIRRARASANQELRP